MLKGLLIAAFAVAALAAPAEEATSTNGFILKQEVVGKKLRNGPFDVQKTYLKYGKQPPSNVIIAAANVQSGRATATPVDSYDDEYGVIVNIGSPAQPLPLDFDTGSSDLWVDSSLTPKGELSGQAIYTPSKSTTSKQISGETWSIEYGDGSSAAGVVYSDKVVIGGVTATSQAVEAATSISGTFSSDTAISGLVGLAWDNINECYPNLCATFMDNVASSLPSKVFTSKLKHQAPGYYTFGYIDTTQYTGSIAYAAVTKSNGFWEFTTTGYSVGSTSYSSTLDTIMDTGTTLIYMPSAVLKNYYAKVSGASNSATYGGYVFPCSASLPTLSFTIGGVSHTVPGSYINYGPVQSGSSTCFGGLQDSAGIGFNILGDVFIKSQFVVFDYGGVRIGVANQS